MASFTFLLYKGLVSSNNFYYCRLIHHKMNVNRLVSSNNFYYCRFGKLVNEEIDG